MAGIKEELSLLAKVLGKDDAEARQEEGGRLIKVIGQAYEDKEQDFQVVKEESVKRKTKIRELETEQETLQDKVKTLESDETAKTLKDENEKLKEQVTEFNKIRRSGFVDSFPTLSKHADFEKIKAKLKIPETKDGKPADFTDMSDEDIFANEKIVQDAKGYGLFGDLKRSPSTSGVDEKPPVEKVGAGKFKGMGRSKE